MIYLFHGSDTDKVRGRAFAWVEAARKKEPNLTYVRIAREDLSEAALEDAAASHSLFAKRMLILLDDPFQAKGSGSHEDGEAGEEGAGADIVAERLDALAASENVILILAPKLPAAKLKRLAAAATRTYVHDAAARNEARGFNANLVNALSGRSPEKLWTEVVRALRAGDAPEMVHGLLHWKARDLMEKGGRAWKPEEARELSRRLIALVVESRRTGGDLGESLERFALSLANRP